LARGVSAYGRRNLSVPNHWGRSEERLGAFAVKLRKKNIDEKEESEKPKSEGRHLFWEGRHYLR